jgi:hypothetical protein
VVWRSHQYGFDRQLRRQDRDADGIRTPATGVKGVIVNLLDARHNGHRVDHHGRPRVYEFARLAAGSYRVEIAPVTCHGGALEGSAATLKDRGTNDAKDSDGDPTTHRSGLVILAAGQSNADVDFGFKSPAHSNECGKGNNGVGNGEDPQPPGNPPINDGHGTSPGNPGNKGGAKDGHDGKDASRPDSGSPGGIRTGAAKSNGDHSKVVIDWTGCYRDAAPLLTPSKAATWMTDEFGRRTNRS